MTIRARRYSVRIARSTRVPVRYSRISSYAKRRRAYATVAMALVVLLGPISVIGAAGSAGAASRSRSGAGTSMSRGLVPTVPIRAFERPPRLRAASILRPSVNVAPSPDFLASGRCVSVARRYQCTNPCVTSSMTWPASNDSVSCTNYVLRAINRARAMEGFAPMVLPANWYSLTISQQLFVVANLERTVRGLAPYLGINAALSAGGAPAPPARGAKPQAPPVGRGGPPRHPGGRGRGAAPRRTVAKRSDDRTEVRRWPRRRGRLRLRWRVGRWVFGFGG
jgi:hypothetical protein